MVKFPKSQFEVSDMLMETDMPDLSHSEKWVLVMLSKFGNSKGGNIFPSLDLLARKTSMSKRAVQNQIKSLKEKGYIGVRSGGKGKSNQYIINLEMIGVVYPDLKKETTKKQEADPAKEQLIQVNGRYVTMEQAIAAGYMAH